MIGLASAVCGGFLFKYFAGHTDIALSRAVRTSPPAQPPPPRRRRRASSPTLAARSQVRADHNHQGGTDGRVESHNSRFGMREMNKRTINIFPFNWKPKSGARAHAPHVRRPFTTHAP